MYLYEGHLGSLYFTNRKRSYDELYCSQCDNSDWLLGEVESWEDVIDAIGITSIQVDTTDGGWAREYVYELIQELEDYPSEKDFYAYLKETQLKDAFNQIESLRYQKDSEYELDYYNEILIREFPFIKEPEEGILVEWAKEKLQIYTWLDEIPDGWRKAFGLDLLKDLKKALIEDNLLNEFCFSEIKEKYGALRIYGFNYGPCTNDVLDKYENLSRFICVRCGEKAEYVSQSWICPWCEDCMKEFNDSFKPINEVYGNSSDTQ